MITRSTVKSFPSMREAYAAILALEKDYLLENKKKSTIQLTLSSTSSPVYDERGRLRLSKEHIEVRAVFDDGIISQITESEWFKAHINKIN